MLVQTGIVQNISYQGVNNTVVASANLTPFSPPVLDPSQLLVKTEGITSASPLSVGGASRATPPTLVTGTGSITATPTAYTTAVTTSATSTTSVGVAEGGGIGSGSVLGKRIRRTSTKYDDFEQTLMVRREREREGRNIKEKLECIFVLYMYERERGYFSPHVFFILISARLK